MRAMHIPRWLVPRWLAAGVHPRVAMLALGLALGLTAAAMPQAASAAEEGSGGIAALGISLPGLITQLVNFAILLVVLRLLLWGPIIKMLDERKQRIEKGLQVTEDAEAHLQRILVQTEATVEAARAEGRALVALAEERAVLRGAQLEQQARADADRIVARAHEEMEQERVRAVQALRAEFADLTVLAAERVVGQSLDRSAHQRLIDEVMVNSDFGRDASN
ncbi:MAG: ATP synthase F0 subunit B [Dehalococcoidia bacterium]|nr:ATP synthase F0 subunit B [Dehalococcoidia bacterium]